MKMTVVDRSEIFRGFLLLIGRDGKVEKKEREILLSLARILDLDRGYVETSIDEVLENRFISTSPPKFSRREFAQSFLKDGIGIGFVDDEFHHKEFEWLISVAEANGITKEWLTNVIEEYQHQLSGREGFDLRKYL
jgi:tellurite resistance protein